MKVGYARTSTLKQQAGLEAQIRDLKNEGCEQIFIEQVSTSAQRDELEKALQYVRDGDIFYVCKLDRLARSIVDALAIIERLKTKNVPLKILNIGFDTETPTGKMMLTMLAAVAEFERGIMKERQKEGLERAKAEGKLKGRVPLPKGIRDQVLVYAATKVTKVWIAKKMNIGLASVYRIINESKTEA